MTKKENEQKKRYKTRILNSRILTGFLLIFTGLLVPPIAYCINLVASELGCPTQPLISEVVINNVSVPLLYIFVFGGLGCILPFADFIGAWRGESGSDKK